jgi:hypothetical protein
MTAKPSKPPEALKTPSTPRLNPREELRAMLREIVHEEVQTAMEEFHIAMRDEREGPSTDPLERAIGEYLRPKSPTLAPLADAQIKPGDEVLAKVTHQMVPVRVEEVITVAGKRRYVCRRVDNGRPLNSPRPASLLFALDSIT